MRNYTQLTEEERVKIFELRQFGCGIRFIARKLNRDKGTISREIDRNGYSDSIEYLPDKAHAMAQERKHIQERKIDQFPELKNYIFIKLQEKWSQGYENSPYAKQLLSQNQSSGMDAAAQMGLGGSSAALSNIQQGAGNIVSKDRQQYMDDLMKKYMSGIGLGENLYGTGATAGTNLGSGAMDQGTIQTNFAYNKANSRQGDIAQGAGDAMSSYNKDPAKLNSNWKGYLS